MTDNGVNPPPISDVPSPETASASPVVTKAIRALTALAGFLVVLIGVVLLAHQLRSLLRGRQAADGDLSALINVLTTSPTRENRLDAAQEIVDRGPEAVATALASPAVLSGGENSLQVSIAALRALAAVGKDAAPSLAAALVDPRANVRTAAASALNEMGSEALPAADALTSALDDAERWVRWYACESLGNLGPEAVSAAPALTRLLDHNDPQTRRRAAAALGRIGPAASAAVESLQRVEGSDSNREVRREATLALYQINLEQIARQAAESAEPKIAELIEALDSGDEHQGVAAARQLAQLASQAESAAPALALALRSESKWVREAAAGALGAMPRAARNIAPALVAASNDPEIEVRIAARKALERIKMLR